MKVVMILFLVVVHVESIAKQNIHPIVTTEGVYLVNSHAVTTEKAALNNRSTDDAIEAGAIHVAAQQCPDGGFGWPHNNCDNTYHNITPPIIDGIRQAYNIDHNAGFLGVMLDAGDYDLLSQYNNGEARFGAFTAYQMWNLSHDSADSIYIDFTETNFFAALAAGTYGEDDLDTAGWINAVETSRTGTWVNLRPWEFSSLVLIAQRHCRNIQSGEFEQALWRGLGTLDNTDPDNVYSDVIGVAGGLLGLARINRTSFPAIDAPLHPGVNGLGSLSDLADYLVSLQNPDGSFYWHSNLLAASEGDKDTQTTSYALLAIIAASEKLADNPAYLAAIETGKSWLASMQEAGGGFASFPGDTEHNTEIEGEALTALGTVGVYDRIYKHGLECYVN
ncbi:MAG: hypothetical protein ACSHWU_01090 [Marinicella sp.]